MGKRIGSFVNVFFINAALVADTDIIAAAVQLATRDAIGQPIRRAAFADSASAAVLERAA